MSEKSNDDFSEHPLIIQGLLLLGAYCSPAVIPLGMIHITLRFFDEMAPRGDWLVAILYCSTCLFYMINRYGRFWNK